MDIAAVRKDIRNQNNTQKLAKATIKKLIKTIAKKKTRTEQIRAIKENYKKIIETRPNDPEIRNLMKFLIHKIPKENDIFKAVRDRAIKTKNHYEAANEAIKREGERKIKKNATILTHGYEPEVIGIIKQAIKRKKFTVHTIETRPSCTGRITAKELSQAGVLTKYYIDLAIRQAIKNTDIVLLGAKAINHEGKIISTIGSELISEIANKNNVPVYICTDSWKYDHLNIYKEKNITPWKNAPKNIDTKNQSYEKINPELVTGIISELGIYKPKVFTEQVRRTYPWITSYKPFS